MVFGRSKSKHAVSEGLLALAEDKTPEAKRFIGLNLHSLQRHNKTCQTLRWHCYGGTKVSFLGTSTGVDPISSYSFGLDMLLPIFSFDFLKVSVPLSQDSTSSI
jgi:hypothetical protein